MHKKCKENQKNKKKCQSQDNQLTGGNKRQTKPQTKQIQRLYRAEEDTNAHFNAHPKHISNRASGARIDSIYL